MVLVPLPGGQQFADIPDQEEQPPGVFVTLSDEPTVDPSTGALKTETDDGGVVIDLSGGASKKNKAAAEADFNANLAEYIDNSELQRIGEELLEGIASDDQSRQEWIQTRSSGISALGFKIEEARGDAAASNAPVEGMSTVRSTLLPEAVIRFQAAAAAELYPAEGPVKVRNDTPPDARLAAARGGQALPQPQEPPDEIDFDVLAAALEQDLNHYLTVIDKGYRPDSERMLFWCGFGGSGFKKVYYDPVKRMPLSRSVDANDLIISNAANELDDAVRVTHRILMNKSQLIRMQIAGVYRKMPDLTTPPPSTEQNLIQEKIAEIQGFQPRQQRPEDVPYTIYECYASLNIQGFEHKDADGEETGLFCPYKVTIEKDSRQILEIRRMWTDGDDYCLPRRVFVRFPFVDAMGIYGIGLLQILGNANRALTGALRMVLDAGMFSSFPGFLYSDAVARQDTNEMRVPPGGGKKINTGNQPIQSMVMPLPYKDPSNGLLMLMKQVEDDGQRIGGTAELQVAEGRMEAPVGTTLAMVEQATKILSAVHIRLHAAQAEELQLLKELFREDPSALWRQNKKPARPWVEDEFIQALDNCDIVPAADPNTPSRMHRIMKAQAVKLLQQQNPMLYDVRAVDTHLLWVLGVDPQTIMVTPEQYVQAQAAQAQQGQEGQDPSKMAAVQLRAQEMQQEQQAKAAQMAAEAQQSAQTGQQRMQEVQLESADRSADRLSKERIAAMGQQTEQLKLQATLAQQQEQIKHQQQMASQQNGLGGAGGGENPTNIHVLPFGLPPS